MKVYCWGCALKQMLDVEPRKVDTLDGEECEACGKRHGVGKTVYTPVVDAIEPADDTDNDNPDVPDN